MKIQDIFFIIVAVVLILTKKTRFFPHVAIICLILSIPLFAKWIFFTAERLTWYGSIFMFFAILNTGLFRKDIA